MPKIVPFLEEVVHLVADFLDSIEHTKAAKKLRKQYELPQWVQEDNLILKKGLKKVVKQYINQNQKALSYYQNRKPEEDEQESEQSIQEPVPKKKSKKQKQVPVSPKSESLSKSPKAQIKKSSKVETGKQNNWVLSQFQPAKRLEDLNDEAPIRQTNVVIGKTNVMKVRQQVVSEEESSQSQQEISKKDKKKLKKQKKQKKAKKEAKQQKQSKKDKKQKKIKKKKGPVDTSYLNSEEQFDLEQQAEVVKPQKVRKNSQKKEKNPEKSQPIKTRKQSAQLLNKQTSISKPTLTTNQSQAKNQTNNFNNNNQNFKNHNNRGLRFFSRINVDQVGQIPENRRDNTFEAKAKYGAGDEWGKFGYEKLKETRGDSFKKTKGKLKNKAFQGSGINIDQINSIPIAL